MGDKANYRSVTVTRVLMKTVGIWYTESKKERRLLRFVFSYTMWAILFAIAVEGVDLYHCIGDMDALTYNLCATLILAMIMSKLSYFLARHSVIMNLIQYAENNYWSVTYDGAYSKIMNDYDGKGILISSVFILVVILITGNYIIAPIFENMGRNASDRVLPFQLWVDLPLTVTPWYEIAYTIQTLSTIHSGLCAMCFDNFIGTMNLCSAAQMKILALRIKNIPEKYIEVRAKRRSVEEATEAAYQELKNCVENHYTLIEYLKNLEEGFTGAIFGELLLCSLIICIAGFQFLTTKIMSRKFAFCVQIIGIMCQLFMYSWTCHDIIVQSSAISDAAYHSNWHLMPQEGLGKAVKDGLKMIIIRARRSCMLTAMNFTVMSLETFTSVLSTSMSYLTLLRKMTEE